MKWVHTEAVQLKKNPFFFDSMSHKFTYLYFIAFIFQRMIFRSFGMLFKILLVILPEGVLNIGTKSLGPDELK